jgi:transcriptional regulator with XRE-family HTH domain
MAMMKLAERLKQLIEEAKVQGLTKSKIARGMGITPQHLSNLLGGQNEWKLSQIENLCAVLEITLAEAFVERGEDVELHLLLRRIKEASPEHYRAITYNIRGISMLITVELGLHQHPSMIDMNGRMTRKPRKNRGGGVEQAKPQIQNKIHGRFKGPSLAGKFPD